MTHWLHQRKHPREDAPFALPGAIYFLARFRPDLADISPHTLDGRIQLYFWWQAIGKSDYPDFEWVPTESDVNYLQKLDSTTLIGNFPRCIELWLRNSAPDILDKENILGCLRTKRLLAGTTLELFPLFLDLIINCRPDLHCAIDLSNLHGQILAIRWWEVFGEKEYPRICWDSSAIWGSLNERADGPETSPPLPRFLGPLIASRPDLPSSMKTGQSGALLEAASWWDKWGQADYPRLYWDTGTIWSYFSEICDTDSGFLPIPRFIIALLEHRPDLQSSFRMDTLNGQVQLYQWWSEFGQAEYPRLFWNSATVWNELNEYIEEPETSLRLPRFLRPLLASRTDLPPSMNNGQSGAVLEAALWWDKWGRAEYPRLHWDTRAVWSYFSEICQTPAGYLPIPRFIIALLEHRSDLQSTFQTGTLSGQLQLYQWWSEFGQAEYPRLNWASPDLSVLTRPQPVARTGDTSLPGFLASLWRERADLQAAFQIENVDAVQALIQWWKHNGRNEYPLLSAIQLESESARLVVHPDVQRRPLFPPGVNVVGFPQGALGIGEDARMAAQALQEISKPVVLINAPMAGPPRREHSHDQLLGDRLRYAVSLFCLPPPEMIRLALEGGRHILDSRTYKIGAWPWELPHWPKAFAKVQTFVDEIWAQSRFVEAVFSRLGGPPVYRVPMVVEIPQPVSPDRKRFGLGEGTFLFYLMFDGNSWLTRKNPIAGVRAFQKAFGEAKEPVGLVIKAMNVRTSDPAWQEVCSAAASDPRIHIVSEQFSRQDTIDFMAACDAYISLHRSEGFGRVIAEAMLLGQPVVVTNFSGNVDYCTEETAYLVDGELSPLRPGEYLFYEGQYWCDPDVDQAASQLRRLYESPSERSATARRGQAKIATDYSLGAVARAYDRRLAEIQTKVA